MEVGNAISNIVVQTFGWDLLYYHARLSQVRALKPENIPVERHPYGGLVIYEVTSDELDALASETTAVSEDFSFALVGLTCGVSFSIALATTQINSSRTFVVFVIVTALSYLVALYCGIKWLLGRSKRVATIAKIRQRVGPLGQEGKELKPQELAALPPQEASQEQVEPKP